MFTKLDNKLVCEKTAIKLHWQQFVVSVGNIFVLRLGYFSIYNLYEQINKICRKIISKR